MGRVRKVAFREQAGGGVAGNLQRERGQDGNGCLAQSKVSSGKYEDGRTSYWGGASAGQQAGGCLWGEIHLRAYFLLLKIRGPVHSRHTHTLAVQSRNWKYMSSEGRELSNSQMSA